MSCVDEATLKLRIKLTSELLLTRLILLEEEPGLLDFLEQLHIERVRHRRQSQAEQLAQIAERKRAGFNATLGESNHRTDGRLV